MRELVLNHASLAPSGEHEFVVWLDELASGIAMVVRAGLTQKTLRMCRWPHDVECFDGRSLHDAYLALWKSGGRSRESAAYLLGLSTKSPLLSGIAAEAADRFLRCEEKTLPGNDGEPLVVCALTNAVAVGCPSAPVWDCDRLMVAFLELLPDGSFEDVQESVDNLTSIGNAESIVARHRALGRAYCADMSELWRRRADLFPHLVFGRDVEDHLGNVNPGLLPTLINRLGELDETAAAWMVGGGEAPTWKCKVTPESQSVRNYKQGKLLDARSFRAASGEVVLFEWHARFGNGSRIHLRFDARAREIEIGYIGVHLPLPPP